MCASLPASPPRWFYASLSAAPLSLTAPSSIAAFCLFSLRAWIYLHLCVHVCGHRGGAQAASCGNVNMQPRRLYRENFKNTFRPERPVTEYRTFVFFWKDVVVSVSEETTLCLKSPAWLWESFGFLRSSDILPAEDTNSFNNKRHGASNWLQVLPEQPSLILFFLFPS